MTIIVLDDRQSHTVVNAEDYPEVRSPEGKVLGYILPHKPTDPVEDLPELLRRRSSTAPCYTPSQVASFLNSLEKR